MQTASDNPSTDHNPSTSHSPSTGDNPSTSHSPSTGDNPSTSHSPSTSHNPITAHAPRLAPLDPPYPPELERTLRRMMPPGMEPLALFRTVAHNPHILDKLRSTGAYLLNFGTLPAADRELVIDRTCARCGCEYEWGVHAALFGRQVGLSDVQLRASVESDSADPAFSPEQSQLIELVDELHDTGTVSPALWQALAGRYSEAQLVELVTLVGQYHTVSYMANAFGVELEESAARFPA